MLVRPRAWARAVDDVSFLNLLEDLKKEFRLSYLFISHNLSMVTVDHFVACWYNGGRGIEPHSLEMN